jgi:bla regulator protein blaR1
MSDKYLSLLWEAIGPGLANHLWQSTLVALVAALLTLAFRKHHARARYWLWLAASLKFLVPFSWLVDIGGRLAWRGTPAIATTSTLYVVEQIGQPFARSATPIASTQAPAISTPTLIHWLPVLGVLWLCGFLAVLVVWSVRWLRVVRAMKSAVPVSEGREIGMLRRIEQLGGVRNPIGILLSRSSLEPGIFGITRPVLLWPEGISTHLEDAHLEAVLAHEVWHVRRRDNLFAALHMLVEAVFWFYPLVWWLGSRLVEERERACDEEVVELGSDRQVYAESILKVCEFCLGSPLPCVSGVTGADLKRRMVHIMNDRILHKLNFAKKLLLAVAASLAIAIPITFGLFHASPSRAQESTATSNASAPVFSSVSIKTHESTEPGRTKMMFSLRDGSFVANGATLERLIQIAYHVPDAQISGPRDILTKTKFDIEAKLDPSFVAAVPQQSSGDKNFDDQAILKSILAERFKLVTHYEVRTLPAFDLVTDERGPKLQNSGDGPSMMHFGRGELSSTGTPLELLTAQLSAHLGLPVMDKTGLKGNYAFNLHWMPDAAEDQRLQQSGEPVAPDSPSDSNAPTLTTALQEQLGLKLVPHTEPVHVLVIDHAELPSEGESVGQTENGASSAPLRVPREVMNGLVREKVAPQYPDAARKARIQGTVILDATIGKSGDVENLQIISGHPQLVPAAIEAVKDWKYNPYVINGEPTDVQTQVQVNFTLSDR